MAVLLRSVIDDTVREMTERGFPDAYISSVKKELERFEEWNQTKGKQYFSEHDCDEYCLEQFGCHLDVAKGPKVSQQQSKRRVAIRRLASMGRDGTIDYCLTKSRQPFYGRFATVFDEHLRWMEEMLYAPATIRSKHLYLYDFCEYIECNGINLTEIGESQLEAFFASVEKPLASLHAYRKAVRAFLKYLYDCKFTCKDISLLVRDDNYNRNKECLPTVVRMEDVRDRLSKINRTTALGKRNYAIVLLIAELGIRPGDVALLTLDSFDWDMNTICYRQEKTKVIVTQPLTPSVGNAVIDYLMNGRGITESKTHFLTGCKGTPMARNTVGEVVKRCMRGCIPVCGGKDPGPRVLRSTLASELIKGNAELPVVSAVLGHTTINTAKHYVAVDFEGLKKCALPIPPVKSTLYLSSDNGGAE